MNRNIAPHLNELVSPTLLPHQREELINGVEVIYLNATTHRGLHDA